MLVAGRHAIAPLLHREVAAGAGIERPVGTMRRVGRGRDLALDLGAAAEAGVDQAALVELVQHLAIGGEMFGLATHLAVPVEAQPFQIGQDRRLVFAPAAADVGVLDAHQEGAAGLTRAMPAGPGRIGGAQMQLAGRAGGKTRHDALQDRGMIRRYSGLARRAMPGASWRQKLRWFSMPPISRRRCGIWRRSIRISRAS